MLPRHKLDQPDPDRSEFTIEEYRREPGLVFDRAGEVGRVRVRNSAGDIVVVIDRRATIPDDD
jgi:hypothetical protein